MVLDHDNEGDMADRAPASEKAMALCCSHSVAGFLVSSVASWLLHRVGAREKFASFWFDTMNCVQRLSSKHFLALVSRSYKYMIMDHDGGSREGQYLHVKS